MRKRVHKHCREKTLMIWMKKSYTNEYILVLEKIDSVKVVGVEGSVVIHIH